MLIACVFLVLMLNSFFIYSSGVAFNPEGTTVATRYYFAGPDPYYNIRTITETIRLGYYPYMDTPDPLLNYPMGNAASRPPVFNMIAIMVSTLSQPITGLSDVDSLGLTCQFLPAIYGALLVIPVFFIGKELFNTKVGLTAAFLIPIIPIHLASGHGSAFSLFDHDSFILLLTTVMYFFVIKFIREKDKAKGMIYTGLAAMAMTSIVLSWVGFQMILMIICVFIFVFLYTDVIKHRYDVFLSFKFFVFFSITWAISLPYFLKIGQPLYFTVYAVLFGGAMLIFHYLLKKSKLPWIITLPVSILGFIGILGYLWLAVRDIVPTFYYHDALWRMGDVLFGAGVYGSTKVSGTIAEASTFGLSMTVMSFGPTIFWLGMCGFVLYIYTTHKEKYPPENFLILFIFLMNFAFLSTAGRFINDLIPVMAILSAAMITSILKKCKFHNIMNSYRVHFKWYHLTFTLGLFLTIAGPYVFIGKLAPFESALYLLVQIPCLLSGIKILDHFRVNVNYLSED